MNNIIEDLRADKKRLEDAYNKLRNTIRDELAEKDAQLEKGSFLVQLVTIL
jgi:hypothetical protein